jgi:hypothetical protein
MYLCRCRTRSCLPPPPFANASRRRPRRRTEKRTTSTRPPCKVNPPMALVSQHACAGGWGWLCGAILGETLRRGAGYVSSDRFDSTSQEVNGELSSPRAFAGSSSSSDGHLEGSSQSSSKSIMRRNASGSKNTIAPQSRTDSSVECLTHTTYLRTV